MPVWLIATAAAGVGAWFGSLSGTATTNLTSPAAPPAQTSLATILLYGGGALALVWGAKKVMAMK